MSELKIITNNKPRLILDWDQLTEKEKEQFDYLHEDSQIGRDFIRYKGYVYDLGDFMMCTVDGLQGWDGYNSESFFSGVLCKYVEDNDHVIMGSYFS